mmetsp:Transcript_21027/g.68044  ORF Transcript_21027/g.68044 Transcript_21027/m.68044 type:complete len:304 (-) Transcript_21027:670-1581(-)
MSLASFFSRFWRRARSFLRRSSTRLASLWQCTGETHSDARSHIAISVGCSSLCRSSANMAAIDSSTGSVSARAPLRSSASSTYWCCLSAEEMPAPSSKSRSTSPFSLGWVQSACRSERRSAVWTLARPLVKATSFASRTSDFHRRSDTKMGGRCAEHAARTCTKSCRTSSPTRTLAACARMSARSSCERRRSLGSGFGASPDSSMGTFFPSASVRNPSSETLSIDSRRRKRSRSGDLCASTGSSWAAPTHVERGHRSCVPPFSNRRPSPSTPSKALSTADELRKTWSRKASVDAGKKPSVLRS